MMKAHTFAHLKAHRSGFIAVFVSVLGVSPGVSRMKYIRLHDTVAGVGNVER